MTKAPKWKLKYFKTGEWQVVDERLKDLDKLGIPWCPGRRNLFAALDAVEPDAVRVVILGQDPYPNPAFATGLAFGIPSSSLEIPPTLAMIIQELQSSVDDFVYKSGDLSPWARQGVLLWNAIPSCEAWKSKSHHWTEWEYLTKEILELLSDKRVVFAFLGSTALHYATYLKPDHNGVILWTSHPSPRGLLKGKKPFLGSKIFSSINVKLAELQHPPINWRLDEPRNHTIADQNRVLLGGWPQEHPRT